MKSFKDLLLEAPKVTIDVDWGAVMGSGENSKVEKKYKIKVKPTSERAADLTGTKKELIKFMTTKSGYGMDKTEVKKLYPELYK